MTMTRTDAPANLHHVEVRAAADFLARAARKRRGILAAVFFPASQP